MVINVKKEAVIITAAMLKYFSIVVFIFVLLYNMNNYIGKSKAEARKRV